jgi:hypothetical protein
MEKEMKERIERMARRTWDYISEDALTNLKQMGEKPEMSRAAVIEMTMDYMKIYGGDSEAYEVFTKLETYKQKENALKGAFPFKRYGW